ncbi:hypothetical protein [Segatella salivae]|uniref:hypothetical protein n=1 Tax=Segatella salivae TaxID=228604 RepID=UPI001CB4DB9B|nr:hypothetical protein [Segatella salivae]MBF1561539.1 hypothetical protein [Segatella salivae]
MPQIIFLFNINNTSIPYQPICGYKYPDMQRRRCYIKIHIFSRLNLGCIVPKKRNTYGVGPRKPYVNPG